MIDGEHARSSVGPSVHVVRSGRKRNDIEWLPGRISPSNTRLVLATNDGKRTIPLSKVSSVTASREPATRTWATLDRTRRSKTATPSRRARWRRPSQRVPTVSSSSIHTKTSSRCSGRLLVEVTAQLDGDCINLASPAARSSSWISTTWGPSRPRR
ncbi:hypothetical protein C8039_11570 [Halogeometricum sp. wsp3]|nr:hypothetical protein C8039_11570 [Halogeometricum sp. wsp3]